MASQQWLPETETRLRQLAGRMPAADLAALLGRTVTATHKRAARLKLSLAFFQVIHERWTAEDDKRLKELAGTMPPAEIAQKLGRTSEAVLHRGQVLGVSCGFKRTPKCRQRLDEIKALAETKLSAPQIGRQLGLPVETVRKRLATLGIKATDGRGCAAPVERSHSTAPRRLKKKLVARVRMVVSRVAYCPQCSSPVTNTWEGWERASRAHPRIGEKGCIDGTQGRTGSPEIRRFESQACPAQVHYAWMLGSDLAFYRALHTAR